MLAIILELISNHEVKLIIGLSYLCLLPAIAQLAIASILEEGDALFFCSAEDYKVKGDDPICDVRVYQALNVLGFAFWVITAMLLRRELEVVTKMEEEPDSDEPAKDKDLERDAREVEEMEAL